MSFWADKIAESAPPPPPPQPRNAVAPGAWWQQGTQHEQPAQAVAQQQYQPAGQPVQQAQEYVYAPDTAAHLEATDNCPRCGSEEYAAVPVDLSFGGASYGGAALLAETAGKLKKCFDCRYPQINATGDIIKGKGIASKPENMTNLRVRQGAGARQGSTTSATLFDNAVLVV